MRTHVRGAPREAATDTLSRRKIEKPDRLPLAGDMEGPPLQTADTDVIVVIGQRVLIRDCLVCCLKAANPNCLVLAFALAKDWLQAAERHPVPAMIVLYVQDRKPADHQFDAELAALVGNGINNPVVIISDNEDVNHIFTALECGARGYIPTSVTLGVAVEAMRLVEAGGMYVPASAMISWKRTGANSPQQDGHLKEMFTARQAAVLTALRQGKANKCIAHELNMREGTVKVHIRNIMKKLKAKNRTEVAILAHELLGKRSGADQS